MKKQKTEPSYSQTRHEIALAYTTCFHNKQKESPSAESFTNEYLIACDTIDVQFEVKSNMKSNVKKKKKHEEKNETVAE